MTPYQLDKRCGYPNCRTFVGVGVKYCQQHQRDKHVEADIGRGGGDPFYKTAQWQKTRQYVLRAEPLCRSCKDVATLVDHIKPRAAGGDDYGLANLQSLCAKCHAVKTANDNRK